MATSVMAQEDAVVIHPEVPFLPIEEAVCQAGLDMLKTDFGAVSDYDGEPLTLEDISEIHRAGEVLVQQYCEPTP